MISPRMLGSVPISPPIGRQVVDALPPPSPLELIKLRPRLLPDPETMMRGRGVFGQLGPLVNPPKDTTPITYDHPAVNADPIVYDHPAINADPIIYDHPAIDEIGRASCRERV